MSRLLLLALVAAALVPSRAPLAQGASTLAVIPSTPKPGAVVRVSVTVDPAGDPIVDVRGAMAGEPLHFAAIAPGRYGAIGAVPVDSTSPTNVEAIVERASGRVDTLRATVEPPPLPPPSEQLAVAPRFGQPMDSALEARVAEEAAKAREVGRRSHESPPLWTRPFAHPRPSAVTSRFGTGRTFNGVVTSRHLGVDFRGATGTPVFASNRGVVALLDTFYLGGRIAYVDHGAGVVTAYMHLSRFLVEVGDTVQRGQRIGLVGATGRVTGPHLHWAARYGSISVNPLDLVELGTWGAWREPPPTVVAARPGRTVRPDSALAAFQSDAELSAFLSGYMAERQRILQEQVREDRRRRGCTMSSSFTRPSAGDSVPRGAVVRGTIQDVRGDSLFGAVVTFGAFGSAETDSSGRFRFTLPAESLGTPRTIDLIARRIGYDRAVEPVTVANGDSIELTVRLCMGVLHLQGAVQGAAEPASITNTQHAGVDEGGIVKVHGDFLVILRRGRIFTVAVADTQLRAVSAVDAFAPGTDPSVAFYDELLVHDGKVIVVGFSYLRGGTEISTFDIDSAGALAYRSTYQLRSYDYYSTRNYAARLVGSTLLFYSPLAVPLDSANPLAALPAFRRWTGDTAATFTPISAGRIYKPAREPDPRHPLAFHSVTRCELAKPEMTCTASVVAGRFARASYVSPHAAYLWIQGSPDSSRTAPDAAPHTLYRLPLDGSAPTAVGVAGMPIDQFSFLESSDGHLNVMVGSMSRGDGMWRAEGKPGDVALFRIPLSRFGDGRTSAARTRYRALPPAPAGAFQNRFVGDYLLYGAGAGWGRPTARSSALHVVPWKGGAVSKLDLPHPVDRIEVMGARAVVIGADSTSLHVTAIRLAGRPTVAARHSVDSVAQGETRSHAFAYHPMSDSTGVLGLPVAGPHRAGYEQLFRVSSAIIFLRSSSRRFARLGALAGGFSEEVEDGCKASCDDWYGNSRPIFLRGRIFALLGYEIVEGRIHNDRMVEVRRVDYLRPHLAR